MKTKGILLTILSAVLFGFNPLLSKQIYALGGNSVTLSFFRMLITALAFWILNVIWLHEDFRVDGREFRKLFFCAQGYCLTPYLLWSSYNYLPSGLATTIHFVYPVLVLLGSIIFYHEGLTGKKAVSCIFCVAGIICLCHMDGSISMTGFLIAFASGVTYTSYILLLDHCGLVNIHPYKLSFWLSAMSSRAFDHIGSHPQFYAGYRTSWMVPHSDLCIAGRGSRIDCFPAWNKIYWCSERIDALHI